MLESDPLHPNDAPARIVGNKNVDRHAPKMKLPLLTAVALLLVVYPATAHGAAPTPQADDAQAAPPPTAGSAAVVDGSTACLPSAAARADFWRCLREYKARNRPDPPRPGVFSRLVLAPLREVFRQRGDFTPIFHGGHQHNSPALGVRFERRALGSDRVLATMPNRKDLVVEAATSLDGHNEVDATLGIHRALALPLRAEVKARYERHPHDDFYGLGMDSSLEERGLYAFRALEFGTELGWNPIDDLEVALGGAIVGVRFGPGGDPDDPSVEHLFDPTQLPGFDSEPTYFRTRARITMDSRDEPGVPRAGGLVAVSAENFDDVSRSDLAFRRYEAEVQQYLPFFHEQRVIALRALAVVTDRIDSDDAIPFYYMPTLGHGDALRGFRSFRFRDRHALLFQGEYRWQAWTGLEMALFLDAGKVFDDLDRFNVDDLETGYGVGFRFHSRKDVIVRIDLARSTEGIRPHFSFSHVF